MFSQKGYEGTTLGGIAERAGISASLLRHYFTRKSDIANEIIVEDSTLFQRALEAVGSIVRDAHTSFDFLERLGKRYTQWIEQHHWYYALWISNTARFEREPRVIADQMQRMHRLLSKRLASMPDFTGSEDDAHFAVRTLFGALFYAQFLGLRMGLAPFPTRIDDHVHRIASMIASEVTK